MKKVILVLFAFIFGALTFAKSIVVDVSWFGLSSSRPSKV